MADTNKLEIFIRTGVNPSTWEKAPEEFDNFDKAQGYIEELLATHDRVKLCSKGEDNPDARDIELHYYAFTDPIRGRQGYGGTCTEREADNSEAAERLKCTAPVLSPNQLYALKPESTKFDCAGRIADYLKEYLGGMNIYDLDEAAIEATERLERRTLVFVGLGSEESWELHTVWFDGWPFAVVQRYNEDAVECFVTDMYRLGLVIHFLHSYIRTPDEAVNVIDPDKPDYRLTEFGRCQLTDYYDIEKQRLIRCPVCTGFKNAPLGVGEIRKKHPYRDTCKDPFHGVCAGK